MATAGGAAAMRSAVLTPGCARSNLRNRLNYVRIQEQRGKLQQWILTALSLKIQSAFFDCVSVPHHQDRDEAEHAPEDDAALPDCVAVHDCPRVHEHDFNVEQDKKHRHDIKPHAEARLAFTLGDHAAFVCRILGRRTFSAFAYQHTDNQRGSGEKDGYNDLQENWQIFV